MGDLAKVGLKDRTGALDCNTASEVSYPGTALGSLPERPEGSRGVWIPNEKTPVFLSRPYETVAVWLANRLPDEIVIAYDGKISDTWSMWGVGLQDLRTGAGHFVGGAWNNADTFLECKHDLDISTAEAFAMHFALVWARKRDKTSEVSIRIAEPEMMRRSVSFVTDRTATLMTMMSYKSEYPAPMTTHFIGFPAAMHMCTLSLVKLLLCVGTVIFYHKKYCLSQCDIGANDWAPDRLAALGCEHGKFNVTLSVVQTSFHLLKWSENR